MKIEFTRHIFATLTYTRDDSLNERWERVSKDFNRYIQRIRRYHNCNIEYLRVLEKHKDGYPHIHCILQFPDARIRVENSRYFDKTLYARWKGLWLHGHSDYQRPKRNGIGAISYVLKYLIKNQTSRTIWKKVLTESHPSGNTSSSVTDATDDTTPTNSRISCITKLPVSLYGQKLATWSRNFDFAPLSMARRPESIVEGLKATQN